MNKSELIKQTVRSSKGRIHNIDLINNKFQFYDFYSNDILNIILSDNYKEQFIEYKLKNKDNLLITIYFNNQMNSYELHSIDKVYSNNISERQSIIGDKSKASSEDDFESFIFDPIVYTKYNTIKNSSCINSSYLMENKISCGIADYKSLHHLSEMQQNNFIMHGVTLSFFQLENIFRFIKRNQTLNQYDKIIVIDLETTSHDSINGDIIEIGICVMQNQIIDMNLFSQYYDTNIEITNFITKLTGITNQLLKNKGVNKDIELLNILEQWEKENILIVSYRKFDLSFLNRFFYKHHNRYLNIDYLDCFELFRNIFPTCKPSLTKYLTFNNIDRKFAHKASFDAYYTAKLLDICFKTIGWNVILSQCTYQYKRTFDLQVWAINNQGIKQLYSLLGEKENDFQNFIKNKQNLKIGVAASDKSFLDQCLFESYFIDTKNYINLLNNLDIVAINAFEVFYVYNTRTFSELELSEETKKNTGNILCSYEEAQKTFSRKTILDYYDILFQYIPNKILFSSLATAIYREEEAATFLLSQNFKERRLKEFISTKAFLRNKLDIVQDFYDWSKIHQVLHNNEIYAENIKADKIDQHILPKYDKIYPIGTQDELNIFKDYFAKKLKDKYGDFISYVQYRIDEELEIIIQNNFYNFFYQISCIINGLKKEFDCIIGSRGSIGASFIAFILDVTEVNPLPPHEICFNCKIFKWSINIESGIDNNKQYCKICNNIIYKDGFDIEFATFINPYRLSLPDIDLNIATHLHKSALHFITEYVKQFNITCIKSSAILRIQEKNGLIYLRKVAILAQKYYDFYTSLLNNIKLSVSQHPGGLFFFPNNINITDITPIQFSEGEQQELVTHFDYYHISNSIMKFDLLAHEDPYILRELSLKSNIKLSDIHIDKELYSIFKTSQCNGLPEFGTNYGRSICKEIQPNNFTELYKISGLMHGINVWANNGRELFRQGKSINEIITTRDDIYQYLNKNTNINKQDIVGITNIIKKGAINKNIIEWQNYEKQLINNEVPFWIINSLKKMTYLFPKPHAIAYTLMAIKIAYFKFHFPILFFTSYFNRKQVANNFDIDFLNCNFKDVVISNNQKQKQKVIEQIFMTLEEIKSYNIKISINWDYSLGSKAKCIDNEIFLPFSFIKGFGNIADNIEILRDERKMNQKQIIKELKWSKIKIDLLIKYNLYKSNHHKTPPLF